MRMLIGVVLAALLLSGCTTTTRTETRKIYTEVQSVAIGDDVAITTRDGRRLEFRVIAVDGKAIEGKGISVARADIVSMKTVSQSTVTTRESSAKPLVQVASALVIGYAVIVIVALIAIF
jgi:hypothetical protein